ncbi:MAG: hypothetical protein K0U41_07410 [Gammaproteobacteria bacterium]|nr:hypothetical protein [Gammaproteobacteria bacterium]
MSGAPHFGKPMCDLIIEPFAGSASYSTYWEHPFVKLYDLDDNICVLWDFLINCSDNDIKEIPWEFNDAEKEIAELTLPQRILVGFWVSYAQAKPARKTGPWYEDQRRIAHRNMRTWGTRAKTAIIRQKPIIRNWKIEQLSYEKIPNQEAHWFVDPPYNNKAGKTYTHNCKGIDYGHLAQWCKDREGLVQVCENEGADWLPFKPLYEVQSSCTTKISKEVCWEQSKLWF